MSDALSFLDLSALERVRLERRKAVELTARRLAEQPPSATGLSFEWEHEQALRALSDVEAEIERRKSLY